MYLSAGHCKQHLDHFNCWCEGMTGCRHVHPYNSVNYCMQSSGWWRRTSCHIFCSMAPQGQGKRQPFLRSVLMPGAMCPLHVISLPCRNVCSYFVKMLSRVTSEISPQHMSEQKNVHDHAKECSTCIHQMSTGRPSAICYGASRSRCIVPSREENYIDLRDDARLGSSGRHHTAHNDAMITGCICAVRLVLPYLHLVCT